MRQYLKKYSESSVASIYERFINEINAATSIRELYSIVDNTLVSLSDIPTIQSNTNNTDIDVKRENTTNNSVSVDNPLTIDYVYKYFIIFVISVISLFTLSIIKVKKISN